jgi:hypothetical protein
MAKQTADPLRGVLGEPADLPRCLTRLAELL